MGNKSVGTADTNKSIKALMDLFVKMSVEQFVDARRRDKTFQSTQEQIKEGRTNEI